MDIINQNFKLTFMDSKNKTSTSTKRKFSEACETPKNNPSTPTETQFYYPLNNYARSINFFDEIEENNQKKLVLAQENLSKGRLHTFNKEFKQALSYFKETIHLGHFLDEACYEIGNIWNFCEKPDKALKFYNKALSLCNSIRTKSSIYYAIGLAKYSTKDYEGCFASMCESIQLQPNFANAHYFHGLAARKLGKYKIAISSLEKTEALNDNFPNIKEHIQYAKFKESKEFEESVWECLSKDYEESETTFAGLVSSDSQSSLSGVASDSSSHDFVD